MQRPNDNEFQDPALKQAICRCWGCDCAPAELKDKVAGLFAEPSQRRSPFAISKQPKLNWLIWPAALAASVLLAVGLVHQFARHPNAVVTAAAIPVDLENALVMTHDSCCRETNHQHLPVPKSDDIAIAAEFHAQLHQPVLVFHPLEAGWTFRGASVCPVAGTPTAHLVFAKGEDRLSLFSLPKSALPTASDGASYAVTIDQHHLVGFVKNGALFFAVGSGNDASVSLEQLQKMELQMRPAVARLQTAPVKTLAASSPNPVILAELLQQIH